MSVADEIVEAGKVALKSGWAVGKLEDGIGRSVPRVFIALLRHSDEAERAYVRFLRASERLAVSADEGAARGLLRELDALEKLAPKVKGLSGSERDELLDTLKRFRRAAKAEPTEAAEKATVTAVTKPKPGTVAYNAARSAETAKIQRIASERLRAAAADRSTDEKKLVAAAIDMLTSVMGPAHTEGWDAAFTYLTQNVKKINAAEERYAKALARRAKEGSSPAVQKELRAALDTRQAYHSKLKGILGEAYASRCEEFVTLRNAFFDLAQHRVDTLNDLARQTGSRVRWKVVPVKGDIRIDGLEVWDEAVLIVQDLRPGMKDLPDAELVMAAQYKVEEEVTALLQTTRDAAREAGDSKAARLSFPGEGNVTLNYNLRQSPPTRRPKRFFFNASGEQRVRGRAAFEAGDIQAQQAKLKASIDQFNKVADELLASVRAAAE